MNITTKVTYDADLEVPEHLADLIERGTRENPDDWDVVVMALSNLVTAKCQVGDLEGVITGSEWNEAIEAIDPGAVVKVQYATKVPYSVGESDLEMYWD